jgi:hypothetical protein
MEAAAAGLGAGMHPRISIKGGRFTLIDAGGVKYPWPHLTLPIVVVGANPNPSKVYYEGNYDPDVTTPPTCYSDNGAAPSKDATKKMARTCAECTLGAWGSSTSEMTGKSTKACNDKKKLAVIVVGDTAELVYELQIPPMSLKVWAKYCGFVGSNTVPDGSRKCDLSDIVTNVSFDPEQTFVLQFDAGAWLDMVGADGQIYNNSAPDGGAAIAARIDDIWDSEMWQEIVGFKDQPWTGALPAPEARPQVTHQPAQTLAAPAGYGGPQGAPVQQPRQVFPNHSVAPALKPETVQEPKTPSRRGGVRAGAGRKPVQEVLPPEQQEEQRDIPKFLDRRPPADNAAAGAPAVQATAAGGPAPGGVVAPFVKPGAPPTGIGAALKNAFSLSTKR